MKRNINEVLKELKRLKRQLNEDYLSNGEEGMIDGGMDDEMGGDMYQEPRREMPQGESEEEVAMHAQEVIQHEPIIGKIRETAIEGLKKYADHPTSSLYEFFKKVFLESDKVLTDTGNKK